MEKKKRVTWWHKIHWLAHPVFFFTPFFCSPRIAFLVVCFVSSDKSFFFFCFSLLFCSYSTSKSLFFCNKRKFAFIESFHCQFEKLSLVLMAAERTNSIHLTKANVVFYVTFLQFPRSRLMANLWVHLGFFFQQRMRLVVGSFVDKITIFDNKISSFFF